MTSYCITHSSPVSQYAFASVDSGAERTERLVVSVSFRTSQNQIFKIAYRDSASYIVTVRHLLHSILSLNFVCCNDIQGGPKK